MEILNTFASNVRRHRKALHLSQEQLAEKAGLHRTYIGGIEQQRVNISLKNVEKVAGALGIDPAVLLLSEDTLPSAFASGGINSALEDYSKSTGTSPVSHENTKLKNVDYALCSWVGDHLLIRPIQTKYEDLTIQILCNLITQGFEGDELVKNYERVHYEVIAFLDKGNSDD